MYKFDEVIFVAEESKKSVHSRATDLFFVPKLIWKYGKWMLPLLILSACSDAGIMTDCPFHRFTFTLDVKHDLAGPYLRLGDSLQLEIDFPDLLPDEETGQMINLEKVPWVMALELKEFDAFGSPRLSQFHFDDARSAFTAEVQTGDSLAFADQYFYNGFNLTEEGTILVSPQKENGRNVIRLSLKPRRAGAFALVWKMPNFQTDLYAVDLIYEEGCYERVVIKIRNPSRSNVAEYEFENSEEIKEQWINEWGSLFFTVP